MINLINGRNGRAELDESRYKCLVNHDGIFDCASTYYSVRNTPQLTHLPTARSDPPLGLCTSAFPFPDESSIDLSPHDCSRLRLKNYSSRSLSSAVRRSSRPELRDDTPNAPRRR